MFTSVDSNRKKLEHPSNENVQLPQSLNNSIIKESKSGIVTQLDDLLSQNDKLSKREKWKILRQKTEVEVDKGEISREDADKKYSRFRSHLLGKKAERKDPVLENHFKKFGIDDIDQLKNHLLDKHIPIDKLDAVLGGMLRLIHYFKSDENNQKINPRLEAYFKGRLGLTSYHTTQVYKTARNIASGRFSDE